MPVGLLEHIKHRADICVMILSQHTAANVKR
jgi:hypothetical protein